MQTIDKQCKEHRHSNFALFARDDLSKNIMVFGTYEKEQIEYIKSLVIDESRQGIFIDVGANIGNHTIALQKYFTQCLAFEPDPDNFSLLKINAEKFDNISCLPLALSCKKGQVRFLRDYENTGRSKIVNYKNDNTIAVDITTLDDLEITGPVLLVKIDVEGHEFEVLQGGTKLFQEHSPIVALELLKSAANDGYSPCLSFLENLGYSSFLSVSKYFSFEKKLMRLHKPTFFIVHFFLVLLFGEPKAKFKPIQPENLIEEDHEMILCSKFSLQFQATE